MSRIGNYTIHESCKLLRPGKRIILSFSINDFNTIVINNTICKSYVSIYNYI